MKGINFPLRNYQVLIKSIPNKSKHRPFKASVKMKDKQTEDMKFVDIYYFDAEDNSSDIFNNIGKSSEKNYEKEKKIILPDLKISMERNNPRSLSDKLRWGPISLRTCNAVGWFVAAAALVTAGLELYMTFIEYYQQAAFAVRRDEIAGP